MFLPARILVPVAAVFFVLIGLEPPGRTCSVPPDAGGLDSSPPAGDVRVTTRIVRPRAGEPIPTNMHFVVAYTVSPRPGATLAWLGDITLRGGHANALIPADVVRLPDQDGDIRFDVIPREPLPAFSAVALHDRLNDLPCGIDTECTEGEPMMIETYKTSDRPDLTAPEFAPQLATDVSYQSYSYKETCMNTTCAGLTGRVTVVSPPVDLDTPQSGITYRFHYADGTSRDSTERVDVQTLECSRCFRPWQAPQVSLPKLGPIEISAIDWMGHESSRRSVVTFDQLVCDPAARPPDAGAPSLEDPSVLTPGEGGCAVGRLRGGAPWNVLLSLGILVFVRKPKRPSAASTP